MYPHCIPTVPQLNQHDMNQADSIRQAIKLRKDLFMDVWPNHNIETEKASEDQEDSTTS